VGEQKTTLVKGWFFYCHNSGLIHQGTFYNRGYKKTTGKLFFAEQFSGSLAAKP
jgi:hypothetical protein